MHAPRLVAVLLSAFAMSTAAPLCGSDWPQYRGPDQTGISSEKVKLRWPASGPKVVWKIPTRIGFSSFAISGGKAFTQVNREIGGELREICVALDADSGKELWLADIGLGKYDSGGDSGAADNSGGDGPRSTPTVNDGLVYVLSQYLVLYAWMPKPASRCGRRTSIKEHAGRNIAWNSAASPVIDGDLVFVGGGGAGQSLLAINKKSGDVVWKSQDEIITHSTPVVATIQGMRQVIFFVKSGLLSVDAKDGKALWRFPFEFNVSTAISPVVCGDIVYCSAGYDVGGGACKITPRRRRLDRDRTVEDIRAIARSPITGARPSSRTATCTACSASRSSAPAR